MVDALRSETVECFPAVFYRFPELASRLNWVSLRGPHQEPPPRRLSRSQHYWGQHYFYLKEENDRADLIFEGDARRLEFCMGELLARSIKKLVLFDEARSGRPLAWAQACSLYSVELDIRLLGEPSERPSGLQPEAFGAKLSFYKSPKRFEWAERIARLKAKVSKALVLPDPDFEPLEALGYISPIMDLRAEIDSGNLPEIDFLLLPVRSGSAYIGFELGRRLLGWKSLRLIGLRGESDQVSANELLQLSQVLANRMNELSPSLNLTPPKSEAEVQIFELDSTKVDPDFVKRLGYRMLELEAWEIDDSLESYLLAGALSWMKSLKEESLKILFWSFSSRARRPLVLQNLKPGAFEQRPPKRARH